MPAQEGKLLEDVASPTSHYPRLTGLARIFLDPHDSTTKWFCWASQPWRALSRRYLSPAH